MGKSLRIALFVIETLIILVVAGWVAAQATGFWPTIGLFIVIGAALVLVHVALLDGRTRVRASKGQRTYVETAGMFGGVLKPGPHLVLPWIDELHDITTESAFIDTEVTLRCRDGVMKVKVRVLHNIQEDQIQCYIEKTSGHFPDIVKGDVAGYLNRRAGSLTTREVNEQIAQLCSDVVHYLNVTAQYETVYGVKVIDVTITEPTITSEDLAAAWSQPAAAALKLDAARSDAEAERLRLAAPGLAEADVRAAEVTQVMAGLRRELGSDEEARKAFEGYMATQEAAKAGTLHITRIEGEGLAAIATVVKDIAAFWNARKGGSSAAAPGGGGSSPGTTP